MNPTELTPAQKRLFSRIDLQPARLAFIAAASASMAWDSLVTDAVKQYGNRPQGGFVSGSYSEHFPQSVQNRLRFLAAQVAVESDKAFSLRPARVRTETMRALRHAVRAKYGSGYYG